MRYALVTTTGYLLLVDLRSRSVIPLENERPEYYGISWFAGADKLVLSHSGLQNEDLLDIASYAQSEQGWLSMGEWSGRKMLSAPHQILCAPDGRVICANTGRNVVTVIDPVKPGWYQEAGISDVRWDRLSLDHAPGDHLNSLFMRNDKLYVLAHGQMRGSRLALFSYPDLTLLSLESLRNKRMLHNVWVTEEGQIVSCDSGRGRVVDLASDETLWEAGQPMYSRGLAACEDYVVVGESQKVGRDLRRRSVGGLWILDRKNWRSIDYLCLGPYGAVQDIRLLDVPDDAHHRQPFDGLEDLLNCGLYQRISQSRLQAERLAHAGRDAWAPYDVVLGNPEWRAEGFRAASAGELCLAIRSPSCTDKKLAFSYVLNAGQESHVSAVLGYGGNWDDTRMAALLLLPDGAAATLVVWRQDGKTWAPVPDIAVRGLPQCGNVHVSTSEAMASLAIAGKTVLTLSAAELGVLRCDEGLGVRWIGSSILPLRAA
jgi:hypothetical protein